MTQCRFTRTSLKDVTSSRKARGNVRSWEHAEEINNFHSGTTESQIADTNTRKVTKISSANGKESF